MTEFLAADLPSPLGSPSGIQIEGEKETFDGAEEDAQMAALAADSSAVPDRAIHHSDGSAAAVDEVLRAVKEMTEEDEDIVPHPNRVDIEPRRPRDDIIPQPQDTSSLARSAAEEAAAVSAAARQQAGEMLGLLGIEAKEPEGAMWTAARAEETAAGAMWSAAVGGGTAAPWEAAPADDSDFTLPKPNFNPIDEMSDEMKQLYHLRDESARIAAMTTAEAMLRGNSMGGVAGAAAAAAMQAAFSAGEAREGTDSWRAVAVSAATSAAVAAALAAVATRPSDAADSWMQGGSLAQTSQSAACSNLDALAMRASAFRRSAERLSTANKVGGTASSGAPKALPPQPRSEMHRRGARPLRVVMGRGSQAWALGQTHRAC